MIFSVTQVFMAKIDEEVTCSNNLTGEFIGRMTDCAHRALCTNAFFNLRQTLSGKTTLIGDVLDYLTRKTWWPPT